jgi:hypothetical protein
MLSTVPLSPALGATRKKQKPVQLAAERVPIENRFSGI